MKKVILVTGASSGLGLATAKALQAQGHTVYGTSRDVKKIQGAAFNPLAMDVTDDASVKAAIDTIISTEGKIDVLINNAGKRQRPVFFSHRGRFRKLYGPAPVAPLP